ncbi:hypothetical protein VTN77DRAFT_6324 [Rasamsonia byssochlamydoides]|uniref:uncharacterized protein n=1 Tax=Rasamsonia byssochlamydoides TaxID=89139 RepID=UPI003743E887
MDLSHLTRPSILCQCSHCSSSLAACENEWAKLSNTYSTVAGWLSLDRNRINISSEKKQIPQSSELSFVRGCIVQEIMCRLCHQKLGALAHLETGVKIFWKLSKVSFREIISMRETQPVFKEGALPTLLEPESTSKADPQATLEQSDGALHTSSVRQQIQNQGVSINRISSSVDELHDTMTELKHAFTALRIELNAPGYRMQDIEKADGRLDMIRTVLKELKSKADEIEKLRLENESLKLKNKYLEERMAASPAVSQHLDNRAMAEVHSPGLLNENGKRSWPETAMDNHQQQIADSFEDDENQSMNHVTMEESALPSVKVPLKPADDGSAASLRQFQNEIASWAQNGDGSGYTGSRREPGEPANKRPRLSENTESPGSAGKEKRRPGRPKGWRKSTGQTQPSDEPQTPVPTVLLSQQETNVSSSAQGEEVITNPEDETADSGGPQTRSRRRGRSRAPSRAASRAPSRAPSASPMVTRSAQKAQEKDTPLPDIETNEQNPDSVRINTDEAADAQQNSSSSEKENNNTTDGIAVELTSDQPSSNNTRKAQVAARDVLAKVTMEREEAMITDG